MNERIQNAVTRLKASICELEMLGNSYWNASLGTSTINALSEQIVNDAKTLQSHIKAYGKR
jgi:hypothetical protein|nr:MAG TPA: hypothetical protein [Caudoviricetes sp.]